MIGAVARVMKPGAKVDTALILEGPQGAGKSSALRVLGGAHFSDGDIGDLESKEAALALQGVWILELAEGKIFSRASTEALKGFISKQFDDVIPKYSNRKARYERQCVFALTTNDTGEYLVDPTGNRRWWPVACGEIDLAGLARDRDLLWAEAVHHYRAGAQWWSAAEEELELFRLIQEGRQAQDVWTPAIAEWLVGKSRISIQEVLVDALDFAKERMSVVHQRRAGVVLQQLGWRHGPRTGSARYWVRDGATPPVVEAPAPEADDMADLLGMDICVG